MNKIYSAKEPQTNTKRPLEEQALQFLEDMAATIQKRKQNMNVPDPEVLIQQMRERRTTALQQATSKHQSDADRSRTTTR